MALAWRHSNGLGFAMEWVLSALLLFPLVPMFINRRAVASLRAVSVHCRPFHQNQPGVLEVGVLSTRDHVGDVQVQAYDTSAQCDLVGQRAETVRLTLAGHARGVYPFPALSLTTGFPFGLFRSAAPACVVGHYVVYPAVESDAPAWPPSLVQPAGVQRSGEEVVAFRDYRTGDALSTVDWKVSARTQSLIVREFESQKPHALRFSFEHVSHLELELALSRLAAWVVRAHARGVHYALELEGVVLGPSHSPAHRHACLAALAAFRQEQGS